MSEYTVDQLGECDTFNIMELKAGMTLGRCTSVANWIAIEYETKPEYATRPLRVSRDPRRGFIQMEREVWWKWKLEKSGKTYILTCLTEGFTEEATSLKEVRDIIRGT